MIFSVCVCHPCDLKVSQHAVSVEYSFLLQHGTFRDIFVYRDVSLTN